MAEGKYELWTIPPRNKSPKHYPWYSERLRQKYLSTKPSGSLLSSNWVFVKDGGDDYRTGIPRASLSSKPYLTKKDGSKHPATLPRELPPLQSTAKLPARMNRDLPRRGMIFSRNSVRRDAQIKYIDVIEQGLTDHPLAVFPHYEDAVAPDIFEDIVETLDPEVRDDDETDSSSSGSPDEAAFEDEEADRVPADGPEQKQLLTFGMNLGHRSPGESQGKSFKWYIVEEAEEADTSSPGAPERGSGHTKIQSVTKDFCDWVRELGGDPEDAQVNNIEESTVFSLFASGYETKPALSVPIHVVQLSDVPLELRNGAMVSPDLPSLLQYGMKNLTIRRGDTPHTSKSVLGKKDDIRHQYGAWYLPVGLWRHKTSPDGLADPNEDTMKTVSEAKLKSRELDSTLAAMHGAMSFREYVDRKNLRRPDFLHCVNPLEKEGAKVQSAKPS